MRKEKKDWENQYITQINRELIHSPWGAYETSEQAISCDRESSKFVLCLDGMWKFHLAESPDHIPSGFYEKEFDSSAWKTICVPGNWETQGYSYPIYTNVKYAMNLQKEQDAHILRPSMLEEHKLIELKPPYVTSDNPTGCYVMEFEIPKDFMERRIYLHFGGVESCFYLWINGEQVGYSQDSKLPAEFEISSYLVDGVNKMAVQVMRFCDGSYLEDQDYWSLSGIFRSVYLVAKPYIHLRDFKVFPLVDAGYQTGKLVSYCYVNKEDGYADYSICMSLYDGKNNLIAQEEKTKVEKQASMYSRDSFSKETGSALFEIKVNDIKLWSDETPYLYTVVFTLYNEKQEAVDYESCHIGFRSVEILSDGVLRMNGNRLVVRGVNRHEHHFETGRTISREWMHKEIKAIKQLNFNAVRTCHYPNDSYWYDLCDQYGILLVDEANIETHGLDKTITLDPEWAGAYMERAIRLVLRDKNHPSIIIWSLGNESGVGMHHAAMAGWIRFYDPYRPIQYESGNPTSLVSDIRVPMYPHLSWVDEAMSESMDLRPMVMCEYAYAKSNSNGNVFKFWDYVRKYERFQGGFVWALTDKALLYQDSDQKYHWGYAGDFLENVMDEAKDMCLDGLLAPDLTPHPGALELKKVQSPVQVLPVNSGKGEFLVENGYYSCTLSHMEIQWELLENGIAIEKGIVTSISTAPQSTESILFPYGLWEYKETCDYDVNVKIKLGRDVPWAKAGHEIYSDQFHIKDGWRQSISYPMDGTIILSQTKTEIELEMNQRKAIWNKTSGTLSYYGTKEKNHLVFGPIENFFRAPTGIDMACLGDGYAYAVDWYQAGLNQLNRKLIDIHILNMSSMVEIIVESEIQGSKLLSAISSKLRYRVYSDGTMEIHMDTMIPKEYPCLPRVGLSLELSDQLNHITWYGRGPIESYPDRKQSVPMGLYKELVDDTCCPYIVPVEHGGREDVHFVEACNKTGDGIRIESRDVFHFDVHHNTIGEYEKATHLHELEKKNNVYLNIDGKFAGLGGDTGWYKTTHPEFLVYPGHYEFKYTINVL